MQLYGAFEDKGYRFEAHMPSGQGDPVAFELRIFIGDERKYTLLAPMAYVPTFGVDVGDVRMLERATDKVLALLPVPEQFGPKAVAALDALEEEIGGKGLHARFASICGGAGDAGNDFDYVDGLFAARFADAFGDRKAMDAWMKTRQPKLGDRTPSEALRLGMARDVIELLASIGH